MTNQALTYMDYLRKVADEDVAGLAKAQLSYGDSWKKRGGVGAFMMLARKWDRLEQQVQRTLSPSSVSPGLTAVFEHVAPGVTIAAARYDIFAHCECDPRTEGIIDDVRDLRRYLLLVEAELLARGKRHGPHRDNLSGTTNVPPGTLVS